MDVFRLFQQCHLGDPVLVSLQIDPSCFGLQISRSLRILQVIFSQKYIEVLPALDSVGVRSLLQPGILILIVGRLCLDILFSDIQIISKLTLCKLRKNFSSRMGEAKDDMLRWLLRPWTSQQSQLTVFFRLFKHFFELLKNFSKFFSSYVCFTCDFSWSCRGF